MAKEYQSEKSPIFDSQKSKKTRRKLLKMSHIKAYKVDQMFCNTRYMDNDQSIKYKYFIAVFGFIVVTWKFKVSSSSMCSY